MREKIFSVRVGCMADMTAVEREISRVVGGKDERQSILLRSQEFVRLRLSALYDKGGKSIPMSIYCGNLQVCLDHDKTVTVYLLSSEHIEIVEEEEAVGPEEPAFEDACAVGRKRLRDESSFGDSHFLTKWDPY